MNAFDTQIVRKKHNVSWSEEYIIAMVANDEGLNTMRILRIAGMQKVMSPATAHKYLSQAIVKKFLNHKQDKEDMRSMSVFVTAKGKQFLKEIKDAYNRV
jgi:DNA-binding MarR family transcriptional regulator